LGSNTSIAKAANHTKQNLNDIDEQQVTFNKTEYNKVKISL